MAKTRTPEGKLNWETKAALGAVAAALAACGYLGLREVLEPEDGSGGEINKPSIGLITRDIPDLDPVLGQQLETVSRISGRPDCKPQIITVAAGANAEVAGICRVGSGETEGTVIVTRKAKDGDQLVINQALAGYPQRDEQGHVWAIVLAYEDGSADDGVKPLMWVYPDGLEYVFENNMRVRFGPEEAENLGVSFADWLARAVGPEVAEAAEEETATATLTPTPSLTWTPMPTATATATIELTPTPETVIVPENQEYKIPQQPVIIEDSLPGIDLELSPSARPRAIYDTIAASMSRFLKKEENINLIGAEAWETMMAKYPGLLMRSPQDLRLEAVTDFLTLSKGVIYIDFFGGQGYPKSGWINANLGFKFQLGHTNTPFPPEYAVGGHYLHPQTLTKTPGLWEKVYASEEGQLTFSILSLPAHKTYELNYELFYQMDEADYWSRWAAHTVENQADQFRNSNLDNPQNNITNPDLFVTDWVGQDGRYFVDPFLQVKPR